MKKLFFIMSLIFLAVMQNAIAQYCPGGSTGTRYVAVEGMPITLTATNNIRTGYTLNWRVMPYETVNTDFNVDGQTLSVNEASRDVPDSNTSTYLFPSSFTSQTGCTVVFSPRMPGSYKINVSDGFQTGIIYVYAQDAIQATGYGHICSVVNTSNCGDITTFGDVSAYGSILTTDFFAMRNVIVYGRVNVGSNVVLTNDSATLPNTRVQGVLNTDNLVFNNAAAYISNDAGPVRIEDDVEIGSTLTGGDGVLNIEDAVEIGTAASPQALTVYGDSSLHRVSSIANAGSPINVQAGMDVTGDLTIDNGRGMTLGGEYRTEWADFEEVGIENLLKNPGFELSPLTDWIPVGTTLGISSEPNYVRDGRYSLRIVTTGTMQGASQTVSNLKVGRNYSFSGRVYVVSGTPVVRIGTTDYVVSGTGAGWRNFSTVYTPTATSVQLLLGRGNAGANGEYFFDSFQIEEGTVANKFRPRYLDFQGNVEYGHVQASGDLSTTGVLTVSGGANVGGDMIVQGRTTVSGSLTALNNVFVSGNVVASQPDSRVLGQVNLKRACDSISPRMYADGRDFVIELGSTTRCASGETCSEAPDCQSSNCLSTGVCA